MSFIGQVCFHIQGICYSDRSSAVQQNNSNRTQTEKEQHTNRQCTKWQKHYIQYRHADMCEVWHVQIWNEKINMWWINDYNSVVCSKFNVKCWWDGLLRERNWFCVWSFWCSELCSVDQTVIVQSRAATNDYCDNRLVDRLFFRLIGLNIIFFFFWQNTHYSTFCPMSFKQMCKLNDTHTVLNNLLDHLS